MLPGRRLLTCRAADLAARVRPGQYAYVVEPPPAGLLLTALPITSFDRGRGTVELPIEPGMPGPVYDALGRLGPGDEIGLVGPFGRGFDMDARSRYLLVITDIEGLSRVRALISEAIASGRQVTILLDARGMAEVVPSTLLPEQVEYVVATQDGSMGHHGSVIDLVPELEAWADQCFAAGREPLLGRLAALARGRDARMGVARLGRRRARRGHPRITDRRKAWLQVALPHPIGCALAVCQGCVAEGAAGRVRICREGPAFAADELAWERRL